MQASFACPECGERFSFTCAKKNLALRIVQKMELHGEYSVRCGQALYGTGRPRHAGASDRLRGKHGAKMGQASSVERELGLGRL
jgi:hypothetical protein